MKLLPSPHVRPFPGSNPDQAVTFKPLPSWSPSLSGTELVAELLIDVAGEFAPRLLVDVVGELAAVLLVDVVVEFVVRLLINVEGETPPEPW